MGETLEQYGDRIAASTREKMTAQMRDFGIGLIRDSNLIFGKACAMEAVSTACKESAETSAGVSAERSKIKQTMTIEIPPIPPEQVEKLRRAVEGISNSFRGLKPISFAPVTPKADTIPASDMADILATIEDAAPTWKEQGYTTALAEVRDMAGVGRELLEVISDVARPGGPLAGWTPADSPVEIVTDLLNKVGDLTLALQQSRAAIVQAAKDTLWCDATRPAETVVDLIDTTLGAQP